MTKKFLSIGLLPVLLVGLSFLTTCDNSGGNSAPTIDDIGWVTENIHTSYWTKWGTSGSATAYFDLFIYVSDQDGIDDVTKVQVSNPQGTVWTLRDSSTGKDYYIEEEGYFGGYRRHYSSDHPHWVYIGEYTVSVTDSEGHEVTDTVEFTAPGSTSTSGYTVLYTEDYLGTPAGGAEALKRAAIGTIDKTGSAITINFTVNDSAVYDGYVWFYTASADYITWSGYIKGNSILNGGSGILNNGGTNNTLSVAPADLDLGSYTWADIKLFHVVLTDGAQYAKTGYWDHRSVSEYKTF